MTRRFGVLGWDLAAGGLVALSAVILAVFVSIPLLVSTDNRPEVSNLDVPVAALPGGDEAFERYISAEELPSELEQLPKTSRTERDKPVTFSLDLPSNKAAQSTILEIANLRGERIRVWLLEGSTTPPQSRRLPVEEAKRGVAITVPALPENSNARIVGIAQPDRIARLTASIWTPTKFHNSISAFERRGAALIGGFLLIALFSIALAGLNRDISFLIFSGWAITTLRLVTSTGGWDTSWLGLNLSPWEANAVMRLGLVSHGLLTVLLFATLFRSRLGKMSLITLQILSSIYIALGIGGPWLPSTFFLPAFWVHSSLVILFLLALSARMAIVWASPVTAWYFVSWVCFFAGMISEIGLTSGLVRSFPSWINLQTGALASAMVIAVALAERMRMDRAEKLKAQAEAIRAGEQLAAHYKSMPIGLFRLSSNGSIVASNPAFNQMVGLSNQEVSEARIKLTDLFQSEEVTDYEKLSRLSQSLPQIEFKSEAFEGRSFQLNLISRADSIDGAIQDITARVTAERSLARLIDHDILTKALNQRGLEGVVTQAIALCAKGRPSTLIDIGIDRFKTFNDLYGHLVGDQLLNAVCDRLYEAIKTTDHIARIGDSFKIVLVDFEPESSDSYLDSLHQSISAIPYEVSDRLLSVTASIGVVPLDSSMTARDAIAASSQACADAKAKGRNRIVLLGKQDMALRGYIEELKVQSSLQDRIQSDRLFLEFQPIVSLRSAFETLNYEVLVRMRGDNGSTISPGHFIPAAERNGQMSMIDQWVLLTVLHWMDSHPDHLRHLGYATVNLSGSSLNDAKFVDNMISIISDFPSVTNKLCFEITETVALVDRNATRRFSERVHALGSKIALDDFGAGYTSFTYLREIEADIIKIDGSFVRDINTNPANHAITRMIVDLAHELGKSSVAEWAEHPDVVATLMRLGVDYGQGFALTRPLAPENLLSASSSGDLVTDPNVRALLKGTLSPDRMHAGSRLASPHPIF